MKRLLAVGRMGAATTTLRYMRDGWAVEEVQHRPLTAQEREDFEAFWPALVPADMTPEQCNEWFNERFTPRRVA